MRTINSIFKTFLVGLLLAAQVHFAYAQTAALLPVAPQQFFDKNGNPVTSGSVGYYIPGTSTPKMVWQDDSQTTPWTNPITLNAGGWPPNNKGIYGNGIYRQIIKDKNNNIISDQPTSATGSGGGSGTSVGDGNSVGTILAWSGMIAPNQYQFAYGQSLVRATYPELLQATTLLTDIICTGGSQTVTGIADTSNIPIGAALEANCIPAGSVVTSKTLSSVNVSIAANISNTMSGRFFPYGNGNGTTTFNVPDLRGRVIPGRNNMGGVVSSNLTSTYYGSSPDAVGANGGTQSSTLSQSNLPNVNFNVSIPSGQGAHTHNVNNVKGQGAYPAQPGGDSSASSAPANFTTTSSTLPSMTGTAASGGSGTAFAIIPPSITMNYIIKVTPDTSVSGLFGVASIGGMQGIITCGIGLTCSGNNIDAISSVPSGVLFRYTAVGTGVGSQFTVGTKVFSPEQFATVACDGSTTDDTVAIQAAIDAAGTKGAVNFSPNCNYKFTQTLIFNHGQQTVTGGGKDVTTLTFVPSSNDIAMSIGDGANSLFYMKFAGFQLYSPDTTFIKTGMYLNDIRGIEIEDVNINGADIGVGGSNSWGGGGGSIGIQIAGREFIHVHSSVTIVAEKPVVISKNPNSFIDFDHSFINAYLIADGFPNITVDGANLYLSNSSFSGAWVGGTYGFYFDATTAAITSYNLKFDSIRTEQGQDAAAYSFYLDGGANLMQAVSFNNIYSDPSRNGWRFRGVLSASISNSFYGSTTKVAVDAATTSNLTLVNDYWNTGATATLSGLNIIRRGPVTPAGAPLPMDAFYSNRTPDLNTDVLSSGENNRVGGRINMFGATSGLAAIVPQANAGSAAIFLPTGSGTIAVTAAPPITLNAGTGNLTLGTVPVIQGGTGATDVVGASKNLGYCWVDQSAVPVSVTGTTAETALATITIPAGGLGLNGSIKVTRLITYTNNANIKTFRDRFGGISGTSYNTYGPTTTATARYDTEIHNRNSANSQIGFAAGVGPNIAGSGIGFTSGAVVTSAVDTSLATTYVLTVQNANAGDTSTLEYWKAEFCYKP